ncbi:nitrogenase component 1 [Clostridium aminobutyricum]|uniref:Nitrogen fixation protein NifE n=1 Tax=Clostridium aminobutyricum TaxID=33953 RepID=A0A939D6B8_CLOAM|nr:nitrogenase component 1 [Clostridium aminobutyricum]MBN7772234.1 nitrogen fixation protein NifE [Clostridium aminobutyricum]
MSRNYSGLRESRPYTYNDCGGNSQQLASDFKKRCFKMADRRFSQGLQCQQINSMSALMSMEDSVFIVHSPQGCVGCTSMANDLYQVGQAHRGIKNIKNVRMIVTNLDERDIVHGGEEKLRKSILLANERYHPKVIFMFTSCASGIIGDDIDAVASELQDQVDAILVPIHCEGFKSKICASGFDTAFISISKYLLKEKKTEKEKGLINLFAPTTVSYKDQLEIERMLAILGLKVNYIPFYSSLEKIQKIPKAEASTAICKVFADEFMKTLEEDYDIPFSHTVMPIGVRNTDKWFRGVAALFGKETEAEEHIEKEHKRILPLIEDIRRRLEGKRVFICGGTGRSFAAAALIDDFGMELIGLETPTYDDDAQIDIEYLNGIHGDYVIDIANMQPFEQVNLVNKLKPDVFIGVPSWSARLGIPTTHVLDMKRPTMGYDGILYLGNKIADQIENPGFNKKLALHARLPYKQSWYEDDAFKFIKELE